jgi:dTDP-4-dehydrorhamnose reductase
MARTVLLTGGGGFLGANIVSQAEDGISVHAIDQVPAALRRDNLSWHVFDLQDRPALEKILLTLRPDTVIHTAALSDIDYCEANGSVAEAVNVGVTLHIAELCRRTGARMVFFSSDSVFDGRKGGYRETDEPEPLNQYARTKVTAEKGIARILANHLIIRPSLIMGLPVFESGNSFLWRLCQTLRRGAESAFPETEIRSPVDVLTLSRATLEIAFLGYTGILHIAGNDRLSRYDMARRIARALGHPEELIVNTLPQLASGRARRPADASLDNTLARSILATPMRAFDDSLQLIIQNKGSRQL